MELIFYLLIAQNGIEMSLKNNFNELEELKN